MAFVTPVDKIHARTVSNQVKRIQEHLEAMQRDSHGLEYSRWKHEVDDIWRRIFAEIDRMSTGPQKSSLHMIREVWTMYLTHYVAVAQ